MQLDKAYAVRCAVDGCRVVDDDDQLVACGRYETARLIAALMNGDFCAVVRAREADAAECRRTLTAVLEPLWGVPGVGRPALLPAFPHL